MNKVLELLIHGCFEIFPDDEMEMPEEIEMMTPKEEKPTVKVNFPANYFLV